MKGNLYNSKFSTKPILMREEIINSKSNSFNQNLSYGK